MRTEADRGVWAHVVNWFLPAEILRGLLIAAVLYRLYDIQKAWPFLRRFLYVASLYMVLGFWAATVAATGTLEGMVYMRPFITPEVHLRVQQEIILQGLALALFCGPWWEFAEVVEGLFSELTKRGLGCGELQLFQDLHNAGDGSTGFRLPTSLAFWFMTASTSLPTWNGMSTARWRELPVEVSQCLSVVCGNCGCCVGILEPLPC